MRKLFTFALLASAMAGQQALAATVTFGIVSPGPVAGSSLGRAATAAEIGGNAALSSTRTHDFTVTTSSDILRVGDVVIQDRTGLFNDALGTDTEPPNPAFLVAFPALGADSWLSTPGGTALAGAGGTTADNNSWFDTTNDGAQSNFLFARLTLASSVQGKLFTGVVSVLGDTGDPEVHPFSFTIGVPEPASCGLAGMSLLGLAAFRRRRA